MVIPANQLKVKGVSIIETMLEKLDEVPHSNSNFIDLNITIFNR